MPEPSELTSLDNPRVKAVCRLREHRERRKSGLFIAEGLREMDRALAAGLRLHEVFWSPQALTRDASPDAQIEELLPALERSSARVFRVTEPLIAKMSYCENPEGVVGVFEQPAWRLDELIGGKCRPRDPNRVVEDLWLVAVGTEKPGNLGAMVRSADAAGASGVLVADAVVDAFNPNAIRASTGAVFSLPTAGGTTEQIITLLEDAGVNILAAAPDAERAYTDVDLTRAVALVIGPEDTGLDERWLTASRRTGGAVRVPMKGRVVDSLNASVTAAILLFEAVRQRG